MIQHWPQYLTAVWFAYTFLYSTTKISRNSDGIGFAIGMIVSVALLIVGVTTMYAGGFWAPIGFGAPVCWTPPT